jgi:hypothetical protein
MDTVLIPLVEYVFETGEYNVTLSVINCVKSYLKKFEPSKNSYGLVVTASERSNQPILKRVKLSPNRIL